MIFFVSMFLAMSIAFIILLMIIYYQRSRDTDIFKRMRRHYDVSEVQVKKSKETFLQTFYRLLRKTSKPIGNKNTSSKLDLKLKQAGVPLVDKEYIVANLIGAAVVGVLVYMLTLNQGLAMLVAGFFPVGIWLAILVAIRKRKNAFSEQLGDCLITISNALRAGYSFQQAMEVIAAEMESPISQEFTKLTTDLKMGVSLENALNEMDKRVNSTDFSLVVTAVLIQREVGGNLAQILDTISDTISERIRMKREINALTSQGKFSALVLLALPFAIGLFMFGINPSQMKLLFEESAGQIAVGAAIIMDIVGYVLIQRIVNIEI